MTKFYRQKKGKKKAGPKTRHGKPTLPVDMKIRRAISNLDRNLKIEFKGPKEQVAFENIRRIALGNQVGRLNEKHWEIVRNVLLRNQGKKLR